MSRKRRATFRPWSVSPFKSRWVSFLSIKTSSNQLKTVVLLVRHVQVKLKVPPSPSSYALFVPSLLELSDLPSALQAFHHSNNILSSPPPKRIIMMLLNALLKAGRTMEASKTFEDWERCSSERARTEEGGDVRAVRKEVAWVRYRAFASEQKVDLVERGSEGVNTEAAVLTAGVNGSEALELETVPEVGDEDEDDYVSLRQQGYRAATA